MAKAEDNSFYEILGVERTATVAQIRKGYYNQARIWHPDKNPDNPLSEERFKRISQAYQILSDPNLREVYDKHGEAGLKAKVEGGGMQLSDVLDALFGGGAFEPVFGSVATLSVVQELTSGPSEEKEDPDKASERRAANAAEELKTCQELATRLLERINAASPDAAFKKACFEFANELCDAPGGIELLQMVAYVYIQKAKMHSNQFFSRIGASLAETGHKASTLFSIGKHLLGARSAAKQLEKEQKEQEEERQKALLLQQKKRVMDYLSSLRTEGQPFQCMRCKSLMMAPLNVPKKGFVTCSGCNGLQPLNPLFPALDHWSCTSCTLVNDGGTKCMGCETLRPPRPLPPATPLPSAVPQASVPPPAFPAPTATPVEAQWACPACTLLNPASTPECSACGVKRQVPMAVPLAPPSAIPIVNPAVVAPIAVPIHIPETPTPIDFQVGETVLITGLVNRPELNGHLGILMDLPDGKEKNRCTVKVLDFEDTILSLKPENLAKPPEEGSSSPQQAALQKKLATEGLTLAWKTGKMFLEDRVRQIVETVFTMELAAGETAQKQQKQRRVQGLQMIGGYYQEAALAFKEKLAKEGKEEQNLLKGLAQMASGGADAEEAAKAAAQATAAAAAASARREAAAEKKATPVVPGSTTEAGKNSKGSRRNSQEMGPENPDKKRSSVGSGPVTIHSTAPEPTVVSSGVDDTD